MAASLPDNLWIGILIMAVIILALLWNDRISRSSGSSRGGGSNSGGNGSGSSNDGPSVSMRRPGSTTVGEGFELRGSYDSGDGSISDYSLSINGRDITDRISSFSGGNFATDAIEVPDVDTVECDIQVSATYGTADDSISFNPTRPSEPDGPDLEVNVETQDADPGEDNGVVTITADPVPGDNPIQETVVELPDFEASESSTGNSTASLRQTGIPPGEGYRYVAQTTDGETPPVDETDTFRIRGHHEGNLEVEANHEIVDPDNGEVRIFAQVVSAPAEIEEITIEFRLIGAERWRTESAEADFIEIVEEFSPGSYEYRGVADTMDRRDTDRDTFQIGEGGGGSRDNYPELVRIINQNTNNNLGDLGGFQGDEDVMSMLEQILEQVDSSGSDAETARAGMDAYQLLLALNALGADLDGDDNQQIVAELRQIRQQMGGGGMSSDDLENALRAVLQDVFGQDLQGVIEGLDLGDGFDEDAIVDAIENKDIDLSEVTDRLDNIEQAVAQIQSQGGDLGDVEQKLDNIESAVRDLQVDDQTFQNSDDESGGEGNKNPQSNFSDMADEGTKVVKFDEQELKSLEEDIEALSKFVDDFDQLDFQRAKTLKNEIENQVNNIKSELNDVHGQAELFTGLVEDMNDWSQGRKNKQDMIDEIENSYKHENEIREELVDVHDKMSEIRRKVKEVEELIKQFSEVLGNSESEYSSTVDSITEDIQRMESLISHVNEFLQDHREGQGKEYIPDRVLGEAPR